MEAQFEFGIIGLGTMGRNLLLNMADNHFAVIGYNRKPDRVIELEAAANPGTIVKGTSDLAEFVSRLKKPRKMMMLVPAGKAVDEVINSLLSLVEKDDIIIDGGNSHYIDTVKRVSLLAEKGIHFMGIGVSGGEMGARTGPSIMPGGDVKAWNEVQPILEAVSAKVNNEPCVAYMGKFAAGHYVKMVHNGIEYAIMQLISETYDALKRGIGLTNAELHEVFKTWNQGESKSFLIEITADIFDVKDDLTNAYLVDKILDKAGAKGTGKWTSQDALDHGVPIPSIDAAVSMRNISAIKEERMTAADLYQVENQQIKINKGEFIRQMHDALYAATLLCYAQGLSLLHKASVELNMDVPLKDVVKIWRGGCIIRSASLEIFYSAFKSDPLLENLLLNKTVADIFKKKEKSLRTTVSQLVEAKIPCAGFMATLGYFDSYSCKQLPTNLLQAQRDYFGAHTYQRVDREGIFHTEWQPLPEHEKEKPEHKP
jgi:6-phosphogluconate dehydrogenase